MHALCDMRSAPPPRHGGLLTLLLLAAAVAAVGGALLHFSISFSNGWCQQLSSFCMKGLKACFTSSNAVYLRTKRGMFLMSKRMFSADLVVHVFQLLAVLQVPGQTLKIGAPHTPQEPHTDHCSTAAAGLGCALT